jgi:prepilin signal peptidase PulO-like enzyme (type II secretory pathway)
MMMGLFLYFIIFIFGLLIGSFLNCVIYYLEQGRTGLLGRSFCPNCGQKLSARDLIPILSFLLLKGKCRFCHKPISLQYPLVELTTGILFVSVFIFHPTITYLTSGRLLNMYDLVFYWILACFLLIIFVYDFKHYLIPDKIIYPAIAATLIFNFQLQSYGESLASLGLSILSAVGAAGFFLAIVLISRGKWMGVGDIKLAFLMGILLGFPNILVALFLAFLIGAIIGIGLILSSKKTLKSEVPFGPFLVTGTFIALFWGERIINWYLSLF